jgi:hypothetical protein
VPLTRNAKLSSEMADLAQLLTSARLMPVTPLARMGFWLGLSLGPAHVIVKSCKNKRPQFNSFS